MNLSELPKGKQAWVSEVIGAGQGVGAATLQRLAELGFIQGEPVQVVQRGPGGREPLAVQVGDALFALRLAEARCIQIRLPARV